MDIFLYNQFAEIERKHWWFVARRSIIAGVFRRILRGGKAKNILDVGCGTGGMLALLSEFGNTVCGLDMSPEAIAYCQEQQLPANVTSYCGSLPEDMPPGTNFWDVVTAFDVIEHLDDDQKTINDVYNALIPDGTFIVTVPAFNFLWGPHDDLNHHKRRYTRSMLETRLKSAGFLMEKITYFNFFLFPIVATTRLGRKLISGGKQQEPKSDFFMPGDFVNRSLTALFSLESPLVAQFSLPVGVSLLAVARKPATLTTTNKGNPA